MCLGTAYECVMFYIKTGIADHEDITVRVVYRI